MEDLKLIKIYDNHTKEYITLTGEYWFDDDENTLTLKCDKVMGDNPNDSRWNLVLPSK
jgi:hypothetical protein